MHTVMCFRAGFWRPFCVSPSLFVLSCPFDCNIATVICQSCSIWFLLPLVGLPVILPSIISCKSPSCHKTWPTHRGFLYKIEFSIYLFSFTLLRTSLLAQQFSLNLVCPMIVILATMTAHYGCVLAICRCSVVVVWCWGQFGVHE